jgi:hypothetical protein
MKNIILPIFVWLLANTSYAQTEKLVFTFKPIKSEKKAYLKMAKDLNSLDSFKNRYSFVVEKGDSISKIQIRSNTGFPLATVWPNRVLERSTFFTASEISMWGALANTLLNDAKNSYGYHRMLEEYQKMVSSQK